MKAQPKINNEYYVLIAGALGSFTIVKGRVSGCREHSTAFAKYLFTLETPCGRVERFHTEMWQNLEELKEEIANYFVE